MLTWSVRSAVLPAVATALFMVAATGGAAAGERVLARWQGGELSESVFLDRFDPDGDAVRRGGEVLEKQVSKAVFRTIYVARARQAGLETSPVFLEALTEWRERTLAAAYERQHQPPRDALVDQSGLRRYYEDNLARLYTSSGTADIEVLFVRFDIDAPDGEDCRARMDGYRERMVATRGDFATMIAEEKLISGAANGSFPDVPLTSLAPELRQAVLSTPAGFTSPVVETPVGLFWIRVLRRIDPAPIPFESAEPHIRQILESRAGAEWRTASVARIRAELDLDPTLSEEACLAAAAVAEGLDREAEFLAAEREFTTWKLADLSFLEDDAILPDDAEIAARIARPGADSIFRRFNVELVVVTVGADRYDALDHAEAVRRTLDRGADPAEGWGSNGVEPFELSSVTTEDLQRISRQLAEGVVQLADGGFVGPLAYPNGLTLPAAAIGRDKDLDLPASIVFAIRRSSRMSTVDETRTQVYRDFRNEITTVDRFREVLGARWGFELMPEESVIDGMAETPPGESEGGG